MEIRKGAKYLFRAVQSMVTLTCHWLVIADDHLESAQFVKLEPPRTSSGWVRCTESWRTKTNKFRFSRDTLQLCILGDVYKKTWVFPHTFNPHMQVSVLGLCSITILQDNEEIYYLFTWYSKMKWNNSSPVRETWELLLPNWQYSYNCSRILLMTSQSSFGHFCLTVLSG